MLQRPTELYQFGSPPTFFPPHSGTERDGVEYYNTNTTGRWSNISRVKPTIRVFYPICFPFYTPSRAFHSYFSSVVFFHRCLTKKGCITITTPLLIDKSNNDLFTVRRLLLQRAGARISSAALIKIDLLSFPLSFFLHTHTRTHTHTWHADLQQKTK